MADPKWLLVARSLPAGGRTKIECCGTDRTMLVNNGQKGFHAHCFRCGQHPFVAHGEHSIDALRRRKAELALVHSREVKLPHDFTTDIPGPEAVWLYKAGVGPDIAASYGFGYSPSLRRVVLPVYRDGILIGYTARSTINARPKYIEKAVEPSSIVFMADPIAALPSSNLSSTYDKYHCVVTEDILSAVRVGRIVRYAGSTMGTSMSPEQCDRLLRRAKLYGAASPARVAVWFDGDKAGAEGSRKVSQQLMLQGYEVTEIRTAKDPKLYTNKEIQDILCLT